jgi:hypothetical protein
MRNVRERPRLAAARTLATVLLIGLGVAVGALVDGGADQVEVDRSNARLERSERIRQTTVATLRAELRRAEARAARLESGDARLRREARRLRQELRRERRAR